MTFHQGDLWCQPNNDALVAPTPQHKSPPALNPAPTPEYVADAFPKKRAVPLPTATPAFATISGSLRNTNEEFPQPCCDSRGVPLQCLTFPPPPNHCEQPSSPIQAQPQEPPPLLRDNSAALQKKPHSGAPPSDLRHNPTCKLRPNPNPHISSRPLVLVLGTADQQSAPQTPSSTRTSPKANQQTPTE
ncbi:hypothetical protein E4T56_gene2823 [Termitomyces sp. T112]|nr:hypothetical protein E4T56_gene2823 [Termitomyces sp. T112]